MQLVKKGEVNWIATFTPEETGPHQLDVSFRTTRHKVLHANLEIVPAPVPRFVLWAMVGLATLIALGYGIRNLLRADKPAEPSPVLEDLSAQPPPTPTSADVASSPAGPAPAEPTPPPPEPLEKEPKL
jgi:hypothetical protein